MYFSPKSFTDNARMVQCDHDESFHRDFLRDLACSLSSHDWDLNAPAFFMEKNDEVRSRRKSGCKIRIVIPLPPLSDDNQDAKTRFVILLTRLMKGIHADPILAGGPVRVRIFIWRESRIFIFLSSCIWFWPWTSSTETSYMVHKSTLSFREKPQWGAETKKIGF